MQLTRTTIIALVFLIASHTITVMRAAESMPADWLVVGAGPSGIAAIGVLLDSGINPQSITWLDPEFNAGRLGSYYSHVPGNSKTDEFIEFINACHSFKACNTPAIQTINNSNPEKHCDLGYIIAALNDLTAHLCAQVRTVQGCLVSLHFDNDLWHVGTKAQGTYTAHHVILATGSRPKTLDYETQEIIPLDYALDAPTLATFVTPDDVIGLVGSSHSAILILKFLCEMPVKHIYNFYRHPLMYAPTYAPAALTQARATTGLKGIVAEWAKNVLEKNPPANLTRLQIHDTLLQEMLPHCTKTIYAIGYEKNPLPDINGITPILKDDAGMIAPRLFGIGIAFPEQITLASGEVGSCIGLDCFMNYAHTMIPEWIQGDMPLKGANTSVDTHIDSHIEALKKMNDLFTIVML